MEEEELDESMLDWWSKYFASIETLTEVTSLLLTDYIMLTMSQSMMMQYYTKVLSCVSFLYVLLTACLLNFF